VKLYSSRNCRSRLEKMLTISSRSSAIMVNYTEEMHELTPNSLGVNI
jgi:hypothetical protein